MNAVVTTAPDVARDGDPPASIGQPGGPRRRHVAVVKFVAASLVALLLVALPHLVDPYWLGLITQSLVWTIATLSVVVLARATSAVSLCQASFMGVAANAATWLSIERGWPTEAALVLGAAVAVPVGMILVMPALRLRGLEITVLTLMVAVAVDTLIFAGGAPLRAHQLGLHLPDRVLFGLDFAQREAAYRGTLAVTVVVFGLTILVLRGPVGRTWKAIQSGNAIAAASGISLIRHKMLGVALASLLAGIAGSLLLVVQGSADSSSFNAVVSIRLVVVAMIGGIEAPLSAVTGGIANGVGLRLPGEFGLDGAWLDLVLGLVVIFAIIGRSRAADRQQAGKAVAAAASTSAHRSGAQLIVGGTLVAISMFTPWFVVLGDAVTGWDVPRVVTVAPLLAAILVMAVGAASLSGVWSEHLGRHRTAAAVALVAALPMVVIMIRTLVGPGASFAGGSITAAGSAAAAERSWGLLVAMVGAVLVCLGAGDLARSAATSRRAVTVDPPHAAPRGEAP